MRVFKAVVAVAAVGLVAGCFPTGPAYEGTPAPSSEPRIVPGQVPNVSYQTDYSFKVEAGYVDQSSEDRDGDDSYDVSLFTIGLTWYPRRVTDDGAPYALQPYMQRASYVGARVGFGDVDSQGAGGSDDVDANTIELDFTVFDTETGLGFRAGQFYRKFDDQNAGGADIAEDSLDGAIIWQNGNGFSAELGLVKRSAEAFPEETGVLPHIMMVIFAEPLEMPYRAVRIGVRKAFVFENGQALDVSGSAEFGDFEGLDVYGMLGSLGFPFNSVDTGSNAYRIVVTYYPVKMLGIGVSYAARTYEESGDILSIAPGIKMSGYESGELGASITLTLAERIDIGVTYRSLEKDIPVGNPDMNELNEFGVTVGVRF